jgi:hypothetical protein
VTVTVTGNFSVLNREKAKNQGNGVMESWSYGVMELWSYGVMELWSYGVMESKNKQNNPLSH